MRFFVNVHPWSLRNDLRAYWIDPHWLKAVQIKFTKAEAEVYGGVYKTFREKIKRFLPKNEHDYDNELRLCEYIGSLAEQDGDFYCFTSYYRDIDGPSVKELPLPDRKKLEKLGLV